MKYFLIIIFSSIIFTACGTISESTAETGEISMPAVKIIKYKIPVIILETRKYRTGDIDVKTSYEYESGTENLISSTTRDSAEELLDFVKTEQDKNSVKYMYFDKNKNLIKIKQVTTDIDGNITENMLTDSSGKQISRSTYEYDNYSKVKWSIYDSNNTLLAYNSYIYDELRNNTEIKSYSPSGELEEYFINNYDENGNALSIEHYNSGGKILDSSVIKYKNNMIIEESIYKGAKTLSRKIIYAYNNDYTNQTGTVFTADGEIIEIIEKEFFFIEKEKEIHQ